jgi:tetratricopeptide (TPR) repeat protein
MNARTRVFTVVGLAAVVAVGAVVGATLLQSPARKAAPNGAVTKPRPGAPPLILDLGVRSDPEARALARAETLYRQSHRAAAERIFARYDSLPARIGAVFSAWPDGGLDGLKSLVASNPKSALAELHLGYAYLWSGRNADAVTAMQKAVKLEPDSMSAVYAADILHASFVPGLPYIVADVQPPAGVTSLPPARELAALARAATRPDADAKILYGVALWRLDRAIPAERQFTAAASLAPDDPMAQTAAAVGAFSKARPMLAFSRLGPLTGRFPRAAVVRFHLGVLLLWSGEIAKARTQLRLAVAYGPKTPYGQGGKKLLSALGTTGTK